MSNQNPENHNPAEQNSAEQNPDGTQPVSSHVEIIKGNLSPTQRRAVEQLVGGLAESVEREKNVKPHPRGHYGTPGKPRAINTSNPAGFRTARLP